MKVNFLFFVFLIISSVLDTEACSDQKNSKEKVGTVAQKGNPKRHLLIAGGGPQADAVMAEFSTIDLKKRFSVTIPETKKLFGVGLPYDKDVVIPQHILNIPAFAIDITKTCGPVCDSADFVNWLYEKPKEKLTEFYEESALGAFPQFAYTPQRQIIGEYLEKRFEQFVTKCQQMNYDIKLMPEVSAVNVSRHGHGFVIELSNGDHIQTHDLFLATGHWSRGRVSGVSTYFGSPWPANDLKGIPANEHIGVFSSSHNGVDAVLTVAHKFGTFHPHEDGRVYPYTYKLTDELVSFNITMYSRSGHLPAVGGVFEAETTGELDNKIVNALRKIHGGFLPLDSIINKVGHVMNFRLANLKLLPERESYSKWKPEEFFDEIETLHLLSDQAGRHTPKTKQQMQMPKERLIAEIDRATGSIVTGRRIPTQNFFFSFLRKFFNDNAKHFSAEDYIRFKFVVLPKFVKVGIPMPLRNAKQMLALIESEHLHLEKIGDWHHLRASDDKPGVVLEYNKDGKKVKKFHKYFIDALGQSGDMESAPSSLVESLFRNKLVQPLYIPYREKEIGQAAYNEQTPKERERKQIIHDEPTDTYHYKADGIDIDTDTLQAIAPYPKEPGDGVIYASGPFTAGRWPIWQSLFTVVSSAKKAVADMEKRGRLLRKAM